MNILDTLFGRVSPAERLRQHQRALQKAQRELDRERIKLESQEKKLINDIKKSAKAGQMGPCKIMAKDLVRTRKYVQKFYQMKTQLQAVGLRIQTLRSNQQMADAMKGATKSMAMMNRGLNLPAITRIMNEFEQQSSQMDMKEEMMSDAVDDAMEDDEIDGEEEEDKIVNQVLDEIGVGLNQQLGNTPDNIPTLNQPQAERLPMAEGIDTHMDSNTQSVNQNANTDEDSLQARLDKLRKD